MRRTTLVRRAALSGLVPLALAALVACGGDDAESGEDTASPTASEPASEPPSASETAEGEAVDPDEFARKVKSGFEASTTAHLTMEMTGAGAGVEAEGDVDYQADPAKMQMDMTLPTMAQGTVSMILAENTMYMKMPGVSGGKYVAFDLDDPNSPLGDELTEQMDPQASFEKFSEGLTSVSYLGEEEVDGEQTKHYELTIDTKQIEQAETAGLPPTMDYEVWLDGEDRMRQVVIDLQGTQVFVTMSDWGEPVDIAAPPAKQVMEMPTGG